MKKSIKTIAVIAMMGMVATGCQKENMMEPQNGVVAETASVVVYYTVDEVTSQASFASEEAWEVFLDKLIALAEEGHRVSFRNANQERSLKKEVVTYTTKDHDEAHAWANAMRKQGYEVSIDHDPTTGVYTCTAIK